MGLEQLAEDSPMVLTICHGVELFDVQNARHTIGLVGMCLQQDSTTCDAALAAMNSMNHDAETIQDASRLFSLAVLEVSCPQRKVS